MKIFPTQIDSYLNCPRKYHCSRDPELRKKYFKASPHLVLGNAVHDALQMFFDLTKVPMADRTYDKLCELLRDAWAGRGLYKRNGWKQQKSREEAFEGDRDSEKAWGQKGLNILFRFFNTQDVTAVPLTAEQFHELRLTNDVILGGKVDRIDRLEDGSLHVIDYKTGKPPRQKDQDEIAEKDLQLAAYALVVARKFRGKVARCSYLYLNDELEVGYEPTPELLDRKEAELAEICTRIAKAWEDDDFPPTPNPLCGWCDFREICSEGQEYQKERDAVSGAQVDLPF
jgi:putative RecB family exonuclease